MYRQLFVFFSITSLLAMLMTTTSCKKNQFANSGNLEFSTDTLVFDTVFTTVGSTTLHFKLYNKQNKRLKIEEVQLMGGSASPFRINADGVAGNFIKDLEVEPKDSLFVFVEVTLDPNGGIMPMIIEDSIRFKTNGTNQYVNLAVWGQDAYFHYKDTNSGTWNNDKPHVIYGYASVDEATSLTIPAGTNVFLHKSALLFVNKGALNIQGTKDSPVTFQGDRLEPTYANASGQYYGIYFNEALPSTINYCQIKNATAGIHLFSADPSNTQATLRVSNTTITNCANYGVFLYRKPHIEMENCIIANNGTHALLVLAGGDYEIRNSYLINDGSQSPAIGVRNYYSDASSSTTYVGSTDIGLVANSVVYGNLEQEYVIDTLNPDGTLSFNFQFIANVLKGRDTIIPTVIFDNVWNQNPLLDAGNENPYFPSPSSPVENIGKNAYRAWVGLDILENPLPFEPLIDAGPYQN